MPSKGEITACKCFLGVVFCVIILGVALGSLRNVEQDEWGIDYRNVPRKVYAPLYGPGRYFMWPDTQLVRFYNTFRQWNLEVDCWTKDGLEVDLAISIQTRYIPEEIIDVFFKFGKEDDFSPYIQNVLLKLMRETCSNYTSFDYYDKRGDIQNDMLESITEQLPLLGTHLTTGGFLQFVNVELPAVFNQAIIDKRSAEQDIQIALNQRAQQLVIAQTALSQSVNNGTVVINNANLIAQANIFNATQQAAVTVAKFQERADVYAAALARLNMNATEFVNNILLPNVLSKERSATNYFG